MMNGTLRWDPKLSFGNILVIVLALVAGVATYYMEGQEDAKIHHALAEKINTVDGRLQTQETKAAWLEGRLDRAEIRNAAEFAELKKQIRDDMAELKKQMDRTENKIDDLRKRR